MKKLLLGIVVVFGVLYHSYLTVPFAQAATLNCATASNITVPVGECEALLDLYDNTNGPGWSNSTNWDTDTDVCTWYGVYCTTITGSQYVNQISLSWNNLNGTLPNSLANLSFMNYFDIYVNNVSGPLPESRSTWTGMQNFNIAYNQITGPLPESWSSWESIQYFNTYANPLNSTLPESRSTWTGMQYLNMGSSQITGSLPESRNTWNNIYSFDLGGNQISGPLPESWSGWENIQSFTVSSNQISGPLPESWGAWDTIQNFNIAYNQITGSLPEHWSGWNSIYNFDASYNNQISGELPTSWSGWDSIYSFYVQNNQISGELPESWSGWESIQYFHVGNNQISGLLPASWDVWDSIYSFDTSNNQIDGELPVSWSGWQSVQYINIAANQISGSLPESWADWSNIYNFYAYGNQISGELPASRSGWNNIQSFSIENNQISGSLPESWADWSNIYSFNISDNQISGELPVSRSGWNNIQSFSIENNQIGGILPDSRSVLTNLYYFQVANNQLKGEFPASWISTWNNRGRQYIDVRNNCITTEGYPVDDQSWIDTNVYIMPQNICTQADVSIQKTTSSTGVYEGDTITYTITYEHLSGDQVEGQIYDIPGTGIKLLSASLPYTANFIGMEYGVAGDQCFGNLGTSTTGPYADALNQWAIASSFPDFYTVLTTYVGYTGSINRGQRWIDTIDSIWGQGNFQDNMMDELEIDISSLDSSCGTAGYDAYTFDIPALNVGNTGSITLTFQVSGTVLGQSMIDNAVRFESDVHELQETNNISEASVNLLGNNTPSGSSTGGGHVSSVKDNGCFANTCNSDSKNNQEENTADDKEDDIDNKIDKPTDESVLGSVDPTIFNPTIGDTCFVPHHESTIDQGIAVSDQFKIAHQMLYSYELTKRQGTKDYRPFGTITREEAARFMVEFAEKVLCRTKTRTYSSNFSDLDVADSTLVGFVKLSYEYEIFNGDGNKEGNKTTTFRPKDTISTDELTAIMVRLVTNKNFDSDEKDWAAVYKTKLQTYAQHARLTNDMRGTIAETIYDLYRSNEYALEEVGYVVQ